MDTQYWGLTERGFRRPQYTEILDSFENKARELFGSSANLSVRSTLGIFLRIFAWVVNLLWQLIEDVYNAGYVDTAVGTSLYNLGRFIGLSLRPAQKAIAQLEIRGTPGTKVPAGFLVCNGANVQYVTLISVVLNDDGKATATIQAFITGQDGNSSLNSITEIINPMMGVESVTNITTADGGKNRETDEEFRDRYYVSTDFAGGVNIDAIQAEILQNVEGIYSALVYENDTDYEVDGMPPHSIEALCYGGSDYDIAKSIFRRKAAGIQTTGNTTLVVISSSGQSIPILFSRPTLVPIFIQITNLKVDDRFPENGQEEITKALIEFIGGDEKSGLPIATSLYYNRIFEVINSVGGVIDYGISFGVGEFGNLKENIIVGMREKLTTSAEGVKIL